MKKRIIIFSGILFITVAVLFALFFLPNKNHQPRNQEFLCRIKPEKSRYKTKEADRVAISLEIENNGIQEWPAAGNSTVSLSYHLLSPQKDMIRFENQRFPLPQNVYPGGKLKMNISLRAPLNLGDYLIEFDLLVEGKFWFKERGSSNPLISLLVEPWDWPGRGIVPNLEYGRYTGILSSNDDFNELFKLIRITLEKNQSEFSGETGKIYGFSPGADYHQIWLRDANTIIPASRYFYSQEYLTSWLEEHLFLQKENGSLEDWFDSEGNTDKNTTETDQEASAIQSAYQVYQLFGKNWLIKEIKGKQIITRLDSALDFVRHNRLVKEYGLLKGAHTADWGDVDIVDSDEKAVYTDDRTHWTMDIYDQSMFFSACMQLAEMWDVLGKKQNAQKWIQTAQSIGSAANRWLWNDSKGFYRVHIHLDDFKHTFEEDDLFPMGGNTQAILSGLAEPKKIKRIIETSLERQKSSGVSTISGTLLPPYPEKTFIHPLLDEPFEYQNGAQWDWFGARLVYAMFENGLSLLAREKMIEIIQKNLSNLGFFEWDDPNGTGRGSDYFSGSAGMMSLALFDGYFGVKLGKDFLNLEPKLGKDNARIHLYVPGNDLFIAYDYNYSPELEKITFKYNSNFPSNGTIKILIPWKGSELSVFKDGEPIDFHTASLNQDTYILFSSDFQDHTVEILLRKKAD